MRACIAAFLILTVHRAADAQPTNLTADVTGSTVAFSWRGTDPQWVLEAGSSPGLSNLARLSIPTSATAYVVPNVPAGTYYVRVRGLRSGLESAPSNEVVVVVSDGCATNAGRVDLRSAVAGSQVALDWNFSGALPFAWRLEVGSASGMSDLALIDMPPDRSQLLATAPAGIYFARIRRKSSCDPASNEVVVQTGTADVRSCAIPLPPSPLIVTPGQPVDFVVQVPSGCQWIAEPQEVWITLLTAQGAGGQSLRFMANTPSGQSGQIPIRTVSGRYLLQVMQ
jgi:hypothetical protein